MKTSKNSGLLVTSNPHIVDSMDTTKIMMLVIIALLPSLIASTVIFGARALILAVVCIAASVFFEWAFEKILKKPNTAGDLSAALTGLLVAMNVPVTFPYWMAVIGCFVAIVIVKQLFGGLGQNFANPAITARIVLFVSFATDMTKWHDPSSHQKVLLAADAVTSATPLGVMAESGAEAAESQFSVLQLFLGTTGGSMGEVCAVALLAGGLFLIFMKIISPATPVAFIGTVAVISLLAGVDPLWQICAGGVMLGAFFMATDYATTPSTTLGKIIFGIGCGFITMVIRLWGAYPEGMSFAILIMNAFTPLINNYCKPKRFGEVAKKGGNK